METGPSSQDSIRYKRALEELDKAYEITKKLIRDVSSDSDSEAGEWEMKQIANNRNTFKKENYFIQFVWMLPVNTIVITDFNFDSYLIYPDSGYSMKSYTCTGKSFVPSYP